MPAGTGGWELSGAAGGVLHGAGAGGGCHQLGLSPGARWVLEALKGELVIGKELFVIPLPSVHYFVAALFR